MGGQAKLVVEKGPDSGKTVLIPGAGLRIGRSSRNNLVLSDPAMSRFHCRIYPVRERGLFVADLGSSNDTCVNEQPVQEKRLKTNDRISIGQTVLLVADDGGGGAGESPAIAPSGIGEGEPLIDLGLRPEPPTMARSFRRQPPNRLLRYGLLGLAGILMIILLAVLIWRDLPRQEQAPPSPPAPPPLSVFVQYEKVEANPRNIFRYFMTMRNHQLTLEIDDLENNRQVRKQAAVDGSLVRELTAAIDGAGFFELLPDYSGLAPDVHDRSEIQVTIGSRTHRTVVFNRVPPDAFAQVRDRLEIMVQNELGTAALALSPEQLTDMAYEAYLLGRSLHDERALRNENLFRAIRSFREAEWYLETIEPKPDFYAEAVARRQQTERELQERFQNLEFMAERAIKGREWNEAAAHLRTILETIPNRSDDRHQRTVTRLLDVERRIGRGL